MTLWLLLALCYLIGSIPFGVVAAKIFALGDLKKIGSGNIGATNVLRSGNKKAAALTLLGDVLKGVVAVLLVQKFGVDKYVAGLVVVLGHIFSLFMHFKGGKGVATGLGVVMIWSPILGILLLITWLVVAKIFKISSLSALIAFTLLPAYAYVLQFMVVENSQDLWPYISLAMIIVISHHQNICRLINGEESRSKVK